jgi:hypothetical protein
MRRRHPQLQPLNAIAYRPETTRISQPTRAVVLAYRPSCACAREGGVCVWAVLSLRTGGWCLRPGGLYTGGLVPAPTRSCACDGRPRACDGPVVLLKSGFKRRTFYSGELYTLIQIDFCHLLTIHAPHWTAVDSRSWYIQGCTPSKSVKSNKS